MIHSLFFNTIWSFHRIKPEILTPWLTNLPSTITLLKHPKLNSDNHTDLHGLKFNKESARFSPALIYVRINLKWKRCACVCVRWYTICNTGANGQRGELTLSVNLYVYIHSLYPFYNSIRKIFAAEETEHRKVNSWRPHRYKWPNQYSRSELFPMHHILQRSYCSKLYTEHIISFFILY